MSVIACLPPGVQLQHHAYVSDVPDYRTWREKPWYRGRPVSVVLYRADDGWRFATIAERQGIVDGRLRRPDLSDDEAKESLLQDLAVSDGVELSGEWRSDQPGWWNADLTPLAD